MYHTPINDLIQLKKKQVVVSSETKKRDDSVLYPRTYYNLFHDKLSANEPKRKTGYWENIYKPYHILNGKVWLIEGLNKFYENNYTCIYIPLISKEIQDNFFEIHNIYPTQSGKDFITEIYITDNYKCQGWYKPNTENKYKCYIWYNLNTGDPYAIYNEKLQKIFHVTPDNCTDTLQSILKELKKYEELKIQNQNTLPLAIHNIDLKLAKSLKK